MAQLTVLQARTLFENQKDNDFPDIDPAIFLEWMNFINNRAYFALSSLDEKKFMEYFEYDVVNGIAIYDLPTNFDFSALKYFTSGIYHTQAGGEFARLRFDAEIGVFTEGLTVTGGTSGATGVIQQVGATDYLILNSVTGNFIDDEPITDTSTGSATTDGLAKNFARSTVFLTETHPSSQNAGYSLGDTTIQFTPKPTTDAIYSVYFLPLGTELTGDASETLFDSRFGEALVRLTIRAYEIWDSGDIATADVLAVRAVNDMQGDFPRQAQSFIFEA